jgi:hypothetical protein
VFRQATTIKRRDEIYNIIVLSKKVADEIYSLSKIYYENNEEHIGFISSEIRSNFVLLNNYIKLLEKRGIETNISKYVINYKKAIMGGHFETTDFKNQLLIPNQRAEISHGRSELNYRIDKMYIDWSGKIGFINQFYKLK